MRIAAALLLALAAAGCASPAPNDPFAQGRAAAEESIAAGEPYLLRFGRWDERCGDVDPATGVPLRWFGCLVDATFPNYVDAHNATILAALREGRLRGMTFEDRLTTREALAARFEKEGGVALALGVPAATAPGSRFRVEIAPQEGRRDSMPFLHATDTATGERQVLYQHLWMHTARVLFDADGRTLFVRDDDSRCFRTFDLARALELQVFPDPEIAR